MFSQAEPFSRCADCNEPLLPLTATEAQARVPRLCRDHAGVVPGLPPVHEGLLERNPRGAPSRPLRRGGRPLFAEPPRFVDKKERETRHLGSRAPEWVGRKEPLSSVRLCKPSSGAGRRSEDRSILLNQTCPASQPLHAPMPADAVSGFGHLNLHRPSGVAAGLQIICVVVDSIRKSPVAGVAIAMRMYGALRAIVTLQPAPGSIRDSLITICPAWVR